MTIALFQTKEYFKAVFRRLRFRKLHVWLAEQLKLFALKHLLNMIEFVHAVHLKRLDVDPMDAAVILWWLIAQNRHHFLNVLVLANERAEDGRRHQCDGCASPVELEAL